MLPTNITMQQMEKILVDANRFDTCMVLLSNQITGYVDKYGKYDALVATGCEDFIEAGDDQYFFENLKNFLDLHKDWCFGHFSYDLKNHVEHLNSSNNDNIKISDGFFFKPQFLTIYEKGEKKIIKRKKTTANSRGQSNNAIPSKPVLKKRINEKEYIEAIKKIKGHIQRGDIFEINFCYEYYIENIKVDPVKVFLSINEISPMPFAAFYKRNGHYLLCFSPERFLKLENNEIISQPIKGTIKRSPDHEDDHKLKNELQHSLKERSENIMITDLVRNDLSKCAKQGSVHVEELCGIYGFKNIYQMISTVKAIKSGKFHPVDVIKNAFPMGSMTGAPKVRAMELIEEYESTKRGLYSGSIGYFTPGLDFDFNVVIRSICYNSAEKYLNFMVGSAITSLSVPEKELDECELKARALYDWLMLENK